MATPPESMTDLRWDDDRARTLGGHALDLWMELLQRLPSLPVARRWKDLDVAKSLGLAVPDQPASMDAIKRHLREVVFDYSMYPGHPRFMAFITGAGTIPGAVADLLAAAINQNVGGYRLAPAATEIEQFLGRWFGEQFGLPKGCGGIMASGG